MMQSQTGKCSAVEADVMGRAKDVQEEIRFVLDPLDVANYLSFDCLAMARFRFV